MLSHGNALNARPRLRQGAREDLIILGANRPEPMTIHEIVVANRSGLPYKVGWQLRALGQPGLAYTSSERRDGDDRELASPAA